MSLKRKSCTKYGFENVPTWCMEGADTITSLLLAPPHFLPACPSKGPRKSLP
ncbi:hypothetical protein CHS0354_013011, partial [Potamilus streckersoni]